MTDATAVVRALADGPSSPVMPVLFVGHGNPMNAIEDNEFSRTWRKVGSNLPVPRAILCVSAHWETAGTYVTAMERPRTIHDFGGFPDELFAVQYPAPGSPAIAEETRQTLTGHTILLDHEWGLDHGAWSVLVRMFPGANVPVLQLSLDVGMRPDQHASLATMLGTLRDKGVLILGSGNIVHNLRRARWGDGKPYDWAIEFDETSKKLIEKNDLTALANYPSLGTAAQLSIPTNEHYLPMLYALALRRKADKLTFFNESLDLGSISMRSFMLS